MNKALLLLFIIISSFFYAQKKWELRTYYQKVNGEYLILAENKEDMPMSAKFLFTLENLTSTYTNEDIIVVPAHTKDFLITTIKPINPRVANKFNYTSTYNFGDCLQEEYDQNHIYVLPFQRGKTHTIRQGYYGNRSHQNVAALDIDLKVGDQVLAARAGIVVEAVNEFNQNCPDISCAKFNNKIVIMHSDGTFADYAHLQHLGTVVAKGDHVQENQLIGYSGNTGFSSGPHLHFAVFINSMDGKRKYIHTKFKTSENNSIILEEGKRYGKNY